MRDALGTFLTDRVIVYVTIKWLISQMTKQYNLVLIRIHTNDEFYERDKELFVNNGSQGSWVEKGQVMLI